MLPLRKKKSVSPAQRGPMGRHRNAPSSVRLGPASCHGLARPRLVPQPLLPPPRLRRPLMPRPPLPPQSLLLRPPTSSTTASVGSAEGAARVPRWRRPERRNERHITETRRTGDTRNRRMTRGRITYRCNTQHAQHNPCVLKPSIRLGAAILDLRGIARLSFLVLNLQAAKLGGLSSLLMKGTGDGANIQNNMARVTHGYLICGHIGEEHLILSAILAAELLAIHSGCVPTGCEEMCGTAPQAETKRRNERHRRGRHEKAHIRTPPH